MDQVFDRVLVHRLQKASPLPVRPPRLSDQGLTERGYRLLTQGGSGLPDADDTTNFYPESAAA